VLWKATRHTIIFNQELKIEIASHRLQGMVCAVQAAASGSFSAAARLLDLTPAAVSKNVAGLEVALGVRLFNRTTRTLSLTDEGERFVEQARKALDELDDVGAMLTKSQREPAGRVRISVGNGFGRLHVMPHLAEFSALYPKVQVELNLSDQQVDLVRERFDIGIRGGSPLPAGMVARKLCDIPLVLVASRSYLRKHGTPESVDELSQHRCITTRFQSGEYAAWHFIQGRQRSAILPSAQVVVSDPHATLEAVRLHMGIAQIGLYHAWPYLQSGELLPLLMHVHDPSERSLSIFYPHRTMLAPRVRVLVDFLCQRIPKDPVLRATRADVLQYLPAQSVSHKRASKASIKASS
jgi:DNA-binding transcriptional LysR family regulator